MRSLENSELGVNNGCWVKSKSMSAACINGSDTCVVTVWIKQNTAKCLLVADSSWHQLRAFTDKAAVSQLLLAYSQSSNHKQQFCLVTAASNKCWRQQSCCNDTQWESEQSVGTYILLVCVIQSKLIQTCRLLWATLKNRAPVTQFDKMLSYCRDSTHLKSLHLSRSLILIPFQSLYATSY